MLVAGVKRAIRAAMGRPEDLSEIHWGEWLAANPPSEQPLPLFREHKGTDNAK